MRFFFYGTLLDGSDNPVAQEMHRLLGPLGPGQVSGALFAVPDPQGWYPALVPGEYAVSGGLYQTREGFGLADLARMDAYEDFDPARPDASLYVRHELTVLCDDGTSCLAQAYRFAQPLPCGSLPITGGDFRAWLGQQGVTQFRGLREA